MVQQTRGWFDTHCHLSLDEAIEKATQAATNGVSGLCIVGTDSLDGLQAVDSADNVNRLVSGTEAYVALGIHPHDAADPVKGDLSKLEDFVQAGPKRLVGIGECGLDYFYEHSPREKQLHHFEAQIDMAKRFGLTLVIHTRDAWDDTFSLLDDVGWPERVIFHCFVGGPAEAVRSIESGAWISLSGILTFKNSDALREVAKLVPENRLLIETDSPYLAPVPFRGRQNVPSYVAHVGMKVAELRNCDESHIRHVLWQNSIAAFNIG
ncbi:MAG: TatD family hydrolase [Acidimicrobiaceae bacterium]|nr:TatD family hydrolase [Acidimicrobiaceae bacterium]